MKLPLGDAQAAGHAWTDAAGAQARPDTESVVFQAMALRKLKRGEEADTPLRASRERCRRELASSPANSAALSYVLDRIYSELGDKVQADSLIRPALEKDPDVVLHARMDAGTPVAAFE